MKFVIKHEIKGRLRIHICQYRMSFAEADTLLYFLHNHKYVTFAKVYERTLDAVISYVGDRENILKELQQFSYDKAEVPAGLIENSGRELNAKYQEKLVFRVINHYAGKLLIPAFVRYCIITVKSLKYIWHGLKTLWHRKLEVPVLDATAIGVSVLHSDFETAGSVMFLLGIGELLEEWTHKKSVDDLARTMSLNVGKVWLKKEEEEVLVAASTIKEGDKVVVHMGNVIPFDGVVTEGEAMVNQASLTGESVPVLKAWDSSVYAGTVVEEGELTILVKAVGGASRYEKIAAMIEETEKLKSALEGKSAIIGSYHFVFEDEKCRISEGKQELFASLPAEYSHLYLAIENQLAAVICIEDPLRDEAEAVINSLRRTGISKIVMMTGDSERTAAAIAARVGVDEYYSEVLPEDKAKFVEREKAAGRKVIMIGDGINDSPALSAADVGIAISDGAEIAREIADITVGADNLYQIVTLKLISDSLMKRIRKNYRMIVSFNTGLIVLGTSGMIAPATSALLHNTSTLVISLKSMQNLLS